MRRTAENLLLLLVGVSIATIAVTGAYTRYVKASMLWWLVAAATLVVTLAVSATVRDIRNRSKPHCHDHNDHPHRSGIAWLLIVPVVVLIFAVPPPLGARSAPPVATSFIVIPPNIFAQDFPPLPPDRATELSMREVLLRSVEAPNTLDGRPVTVIGFTLKQGDHTDLGRFVITCCVADAQLVRVHLDGDAVASAGPYPDNTWLSVEGTIRVGKHLAGRPTIPTVDVAHLTRIDPPDDPYA